MSHSSARFAAVLVAAVLVVASTSVGEGQVVNICSNPATVIDGSITAPLLWRERPGGYRRVNCPVFPFYLAYVIRGDVLVVVAVAHASRKPGFWHERLE